jgi:hypothetical protein
MTVERHPPPSKSPFARQPVSGSPHGLRRQRSRVAKDAERPYGRIVLDVVTEAPAQHTLRPYRREVAVCFVVATLAALAVGALAYVPTLVVAVLAFGFGMGGLGLGWAIALPTLLLFPPALVFFAIAIPWNARISRRHGRGRRNLGWAAAAWGLAWVAFIIVMWTLAP